MNFLAHIYLSGDHELVKIGNFVADSVRGKKYLDYATPIQQGIILHREIDTYTDAHPIWRQTKKSLVPRYNHYGAVIVDMFYDHYLACNWDTYCSVPLEVYVSQFYESLTQNFDHLPERVQRFLPIMLDENWLLKYRDIKGLEYILQKMDSRTKYLSKMSFATEELILHYDTYQREFEAFFKELELHVSSFINTPRYTALEVSI